MEYKFWKNGSGRSPVMDELTAVSLADSDSGKSYWLILDRVKKYTYPQLLHARLLKKLIGKNPYKIFELRFSLPRRIARTFCIIDHNSTLWLLHLVIKKKDNTKPTDIRLAEQRADLLNQTIHYL